MTISFDLTPAQEEVALAVLAKRQETNPDLTLNEMFRLEAFHALGLTRAQLAERKRREAAEKLVVLSDADLQEVRDLIDSKNPEPVLP